jgi:TRAP-type mannitol/chloroaromatic compound transport system permease large subunit
MNPRASQLVSMRHQLHGAQHELLAYSGVQAAGTTMAVYVWFEHMILSIAGGCYTSAGSLTYSMLCPGVLAQLLVFVLVDVIAAYKLPAAAKQRAQEARAKLEQEAMKAVRAMGAWGE